MATKVDPRTVTSDSGLLSVTIIKGKAGPIKGSVTPTEQLLEEVFDRGK